VIALHFVAIGLGPEGELLLRFHPFGDNPEIQFCPKEITAPATALSLSLRARSLIKDLSIFSRATGNVFNTLRLEYPVPKSSIESWMPSPCNSFIVATACSTSRMTRLSVISNSRNCASKPLSRNALTTRLGRTSAKSRRQHVRGRYAEQFGRAFWLTRALSLNCLAETFTETFMRGKPSFCHALFCRQASRRTQSPISTIRPVSSARGILYRGDQTQGWVPPTYQSVYGKDRACTKVNLRLIQKHEFRVDQSIS